MNAQKKRDLLNKVKDAQERLEFVADGQNEIGNLCIVVSQLADVVFTVVSQLPTEDIDEADAMFKQHQEMKEAHKRIYDDEPDGVELADFCGDHPYKSNYNPW